MGRWGWQQAGDKPAGWLGARVHQPLARYCWHGSSPAAADVAARQQHSAHKHRHQNTTTTTTTVYTRIHTTPPRTPPLVPYLVQQPPPTAATPCHARPPPYACREAAGQAGRGRAAAFQAPTPTHTFLPPLPRSQFTSTASSTCAQGCGRGCGLPGGAPQGGGGVAQVRCHVLRSRLSSECVCVCV